MATQIKAIVFDSDGTLLNSRELIFAAYEHVARQHGFVPPTDDEIMRHMGKSLREMYQAMFPDGDADQLVKANGEYILSHSLEVRGFDGLEDMLQTLRAAGIKLGIVTGGNHKINDLLQHHNIAHYFGSVVHSERIARQKPDPEGVLLALRELQVVPAQAAVVGDMHYDIQAGKNAGAGMTIGVTHGFGSRQSLTDAGADHLADSLLEVPQLLGIPRL